MADRFREEAAEVAEPWLDGMTPIWLALRDHYRNLLGSNPEHAVQIMEALAASPDVTTRQAATYGVDLVYLADPAQAHDVFSVLLQDDEPRVRTSMHENLNRYADEGMPYRDDVIDIGYIATLPVHHLAVMTVEGPDGTEVVLTPDTPDNLYPFQYER